MEWQSISIFSSIVLFGILETIFPFFDYKHRNDRGNYTNFSLGIINLFAISISTAWLLNLVWKQTAWLGFLNFIKSPWIVIIFTFLLLDLYMYAWHRLMHTLPLGWRFHIIHHTELSMNVSTVYRFHIVEAVLLNFPKIFLIWLFGIQQTNLFLYEILYVILLLFQHSNWALSLTIDKFFSNFIVTPNYHRAHHSQETVQCNYASFLSIWDRMFKSYHYPKVPRTIKLGLPNQTKEFDFIGLLKLPFSSNL